MQRSVLNSLLNTRKLLVSSHGSSSRMIINHSLGIRRLPGSVQMFQPARAYSVEPTPGLDDYELELFGILNKSLNPEVLDVRDVSGGCGSMFAINIVSEKFNGLSLIKQQRLVNEILKDEIAKWHGLQLRTKALEKYNK